MDTSRSADAGRRWSAGAYVFAGRADPVWPLTQAQVRRLLGIWENLLPASSTSRPQRPMLGYRGCFISDGVGHEWLACEGFAEHRGVADVDVRGDPSRSFEQAIAACAPLGMLPPDLFDSD